ncbi:MAG: phosphatidate cytidylyltransferase [Bdellovibrionaceae bacterium]|jgi:phosphatidate cytidylyltransferase|nr:phosphatidate cytidylyltransferase [Pseudobdellovibrionaceae bacterium]
MNSAHLWSDPLYRETAALILIFLFGLSGIVFFLRKKNTLFKASWESLKSWIFMTPIILLFFGFTKPWPIILLTIVGIYAAKIFFQMVGMYHRGWFVWVSYVFIALFGVSIHYQVFAIYDLLPMIFLGLASIIPLIRNSAKRMVQYIALSLMAVIFFGWSLLHLGKILDFEKGIYIVIYIYLLSEIAENVSITVNYLWSKHKFFTKISNRVSLEGLLASVFFTLVLAWAMRHLLPIRTEPYWIAAGLICSLVGRFGSLFISVIRRDLGLKDTGVFIIGRGDMVDRIDKLIFTAPVFYYAYIYINRTF